MMSSENGNSSGKSLRSAAVTVEDMEEQLLALAEYRMPFGKYRGRKLIDLPEPYVVWFAQKGFPKGRLGTMLAIVYEIKVNGLEYLFDPLR